MSPTNTPIIPLPPEWVPKPDKTSKEESPKEAPGLDEKVTKGMLVITKKDKQILTAYLSTAIGPMLATLAGVAIVAVASQLLPPSFGWEEHIVRAVLLKICLAVLFIGIAVILIFLSFQMPSWIKGGREARERKREAHEQKRKKREQYRREVEIWRQQQQAEEKKRRDSQNKD